MRLKSSVRTKSYKCEKICIPKFNDIARHCLSRRYTFQCTISQFSETHVIVRLNLNALFENEKLPFIKLKNNVYERRFKKKKAAFVGNTSH